jgi:hypothetical protein
VQIETDLALNAHRISAHRALTLNPSVAKIGEQAALAGLRTGNTNHPVNVGYRIGGRWHSDVATALLNDFDFLTPARRGPKSRPANPLATELASAQKENAQLRRRLERAEAIIDVQKKLADLLGIQLAPIAPEIVRDNTP